jgi:XTP/dITP diphosphohydrolase
MKIVCASNNKYKLDEIRYAINSAIPDEIELIGLQEVGIHDELPETKETLEGNAEQKAEYIYEKYTYDCMADDTGLEVYSLQNRPGVYSARYAGVGCSFDDNIDKLLHELTGIEKRKARFRTVIALIINGEKFYFEGSVEGYITYSRSGENGFGYDSVFRPRGSQKTFAQMNLNQKNKISHRAKAVEKLVKFLIKRKNS